MQVRTNPVVEVHCRQGVWGDGDGRDGRVHGMWALEGPSAPPS